MIRVSKTLAVAMGIFLWTAPAMASEVEAELAEMRRLVEGLQDKVDAQEEQLSQQERNLEEAQRVVRRTQEETEAVSGLSSFLNSLEVEGWIAASYAYNLTNNPDSTPFAGVPGNSGGGNPPGSTGLNSGTSGAFLPFHNDHDTFKVDQIWFGLGKPATEESRAGFRFDIVYGATATTLGNTSPTGSRGGTLDETGDMYIHQAYVEYLAPLGDGVQVRGGKFGTITGAEVAQTTQNFNITRSSLFSLLQPIDHTGVLVTSDFGPLSLSAGAANSGLIGVGTVDDNREKTLLFQAGMGDDALSATSTLIWGAEGGSNVDDVGLFDFVLTANPTDSLSMWLNVDYLWSNGDAKRAVTAPGPSTNGDAWGIAAAARLALSDQLGVSLRAEYVADNRGRLGLRQATRPIPPNAIIQDIRENSTWGITATVDYTVVENLMVRLESRYDRADSVSQFYNDTGDGVDRDQWVVLAEAVYTF